MTTDTKGIAGADGPASVSYSYEWLGSDDGLDTEITGEMGSFYTGGGRAPNDDSVTGCQTLRRRSIEGAGTLLGYVHLR